MGVGPPGEEVDATSEWGKGGEREGPPLPLFPFPVLAVAVSPLESLPAGVWPGPFGP